MKQLPALFIIGAGGHGRVVADIASEMGYRDISFFDARWPTLQKNMEWPVIGAEMSMLDVEHHIIVAVGECIARNRQVRKLLESGRTVPILRHPSAQISKYSVIGNGSVIMPLVCINAGTKLGNAVIANSSCSIDHDCEIEDGAHISPGAVLAGTVKVGQDTWVGAGAIVREGVRIGRNCVIAAGSVVIEDVPDDTRVAGVPARKMI